MTAPVLHEQYGVVETVHNDEGDVVEERMSSLHVFDTQAEAEGHVEWLLHYRRPYMREAAEHEAEEEKRTGRITTNEKRYHLRRELLSSYSVVRREVTPWERVP